jgi:hypothetical protein
MDGASGTPGIVGMASVDIKAGSPIMKAAKPPVGEGIKPLSPKPSSTVAYDGELLKTASGSMDQGQTDSSGVTKTVPSIDAARKISANKLAVLGITI